MTQSIWSPHMSTGLNALDSLHHDFLDSLARLDSVEEKDFPHAYATLLCKVEHAFANEEMWMEEIEFAGLKSHREQHARVLAALHQIHPKIMDGELAEGRHVVSTLLPQWFSLHISTMDMALGTAVSASKVEAHITGKVPEVVD